MSVSKSTATAFVAAMDIQVPSTGRMNPAKTAKARCDALTPKQYHELLQADLIRVTPNGGVGMTEMGLAFRDGFKLGRS
jgi:hypothetical protein